MEKKEGETIEIKEDIIVKKEDKSEKDKEKIELEIPQNMEESEQINKLRELNKIELKDEKKKPPCACKCIIF